MDNHSITLVRLSELVSSRCVALRAREQPNNENQIRGWHSHKSWWGLDCFISDDRTWSTKCLFWVTYDLVSGAVEAEPRSMTIRETVLAVFSDVGKYVGKH